MKIKSINFMAEAAISPLILPKVFDLAKGMFKN